jgi:hypothetical protein
LVHKYGNVLLPDIIDFDDPTFEAIKKSISSLVGKSARYFVEDFEQLEREAKNEEYVSPKSLIRISQSFY